MWYKDRIISYVTKIVIIKKHSGKTARSVQDVCLNHDLQR